MKRTSSFALVILLFIVLFTTQACFLFRNVTIAVENESLTIGVGESKQIEFKVKPEDATVKFSSSDESVASVSSTGVVVGVSEGETEITIEGTKDKYKTAVKKVGVQVVGEDYYSVTFTVSDSDGVIQGAEVSFNSDSKTTDSEGKAVFTDVLAGSKDYSVSKAGYDDATGTVEVDSDESVNVTLIKKTYTITASAGTGGSISPSGEVIVEHGSSKTFTMSPSEGYSVEDVLVDGESVGPRDTYTFSNITSNHTVSVSFTTLPPETYTVTFNVTDSEGTLQGAEVSFNGESKTTDVQGKAVFVNVLSGSKAYTVSKESYNNETGTVNVDSDRSVNVTLTKKTYTITASAGTGGSISPSGEVIVEHGSSKTFTMSPSEGYSVEDVLVDNESVGPRDTYTFYNITSSHTIYVSFATLPPETYTVTFNVSDSSGAVQGANVSFNGDNKGTDALGKAVFTGVLVGSRAYTVSKEGYNNSTGNVDVDGDESVDVTLTKKTYTLAVNIIGQGTVTKNPDEATYTHGEVVQLTANPADNWDFTGWSGDLAGSANPDTITMNSDKTVTANFSIVQYTITASAGTGGTISPSGQVKVNHGSNQSFSISANTGYDIQDVKVDGATEGAIGSYTFSNVTSDHTIAATFKIETYTISVSSDPAEGGSVNGGGTYNHGAQVSCQATANEGYRFVNWTEGGVVVSDNSTYTFNITANRNLVANFVRVYSVTFSVVDSEGVLQGAEVSFNGETKVTDVQGKAVFTGVVTGSKAYTVSKEGYNSAAGTIDVDSDESVDITLVKKTYTLSVSTVGQGTVTKNPDKATYTHGEVVQLTANPDSGWNFDSWSGDLTGSTNPANITMDSNKTVTATFTIKKYTIAASANPQAGGTVTGAGSYNHGDTVNLVATANEGYEFVNWTENGVQVSANTTYSFTATANRTLVANFRLKTYTINATAGAGGNINPAGSVNVTHGSSQSFTIIPNANYDIGDVKVDGVSVGAVSSYTFNNVIANHTIAATFKLKTYTLTANVVGQGTVTKNPSKPTYDHGEEVQLTATPDEGWDFTGWSGDLSGTANPANITMDSNKTVTATFTIKKYTIAASANPPAGGTVSGAGSYNHGDTVNLVATANEGYEFVNWTENGVQVSANTTYSFTATANRTLVANFRLKTYTITATAGAGGSIDPSGNVSVNHGDDQSFAITPDEGYNVEDVLIDGESVGPRTSYTFTGVASDHTIHASFSLLPPPTYTITFNVSDNQGAVQGASVTFYGETKATDAQGKATFTGVLAGNRAYTVSKTGYNNATGNVNVDGDETVDVILTKKTYTITATAGAGGNINPAGNVQVEHGSNRLFNITPNTGYEIEDVKVDGVSIGAVSTYNFTNVTTNHTIHATFRLKSYTIAVSANPQAGGNVGGGGNYTHGDTVNLVATANEGYEFVNWTENGVQVSANAAYSFTATANRTLVANFRLKTYTITATAGAGGNINPSGNVNVTHGSNQSFAITPNTGYDIEDVKVDGISVGAVSSYTFNNVTANHTIAATFKLKTYTLTTNVVGQGTVTKNPDKSKYNHGEVVQLTANPSAGWAFNTWSGDLNGSANPANLTMNGNKTVTANFVRVYTVTFNVSDNQGSVQGASVTFNGETKNTNASGQAVFTNVQSGTRSYTISKTGYNNATGNVNVDGDKTVNVTLTKKTYTIAVSANPAAGGTAAGGGVYTHGDTVNLSATPKEGYRFVNWTENGAQVSTNASYSFTATKNRTLVANFTTTSKGTIQINNTTMDGFGQIDIYAEDFEFGVTAIEYVLSFDTTKLSVLAMSNDAGLGWSLANMIRNTGGIIHFIAGGQPVNLAGRTKIATILVSEISSGSTTIGFTSYVYNDSPVETAVADDSQPPQEIRSPNITLIPGTITIN